MNIYNEFNKQFNGELLEKERLSKHTSFRIGGPADLMAVARNNEELLEAVTLSLKLNIPFFILGGGTNVVFHDMGFRGIVIKNLCLNYNVEGKRVFTECGVSISRLAEDVSKRGLKGLEHLGGLPGTVGGAITGNAGAYGKSIGDALEKATVFLLNEQCLKEVDRDFFNFSYRYSVLKHGEVKGIVISASLKLEEGNSEELIKIIKNDRHKRVTEHPVDPSAGCIFKNIEDGEKTGLDKSLIVHNKIPAGKLIDVMGLKGLNVGDAMVSEKHGNYIINKGHATCDNVKELIKVIKGRIKEEYNIELYEEVQFVPEVIKE